MFVTGYVFNTKRSNKTQASFGELFSPLGRASLCWGLSCGVILLLLVPAWCHANSANTQQLGPAPETSHALNIERLSGESNEGQVVIDRLEYAIDNTDRHNQLGVYEITAWYGNQANQVVMVAEGEVQSASLTSSEHRLLWQHNIAEAFDIQSGLRFVNADGYAWQGAYMALTGTLLSQLSVELSAALGNLGPAEFNLELETQLPISPSFFWVAQLLFTGYDGNDPANGLGSGLAAISSEVRTHYQLSESATIYLGMTWRHTYGKTANLAAHANESQHQLQWLLGTRFIF